MSDARRRAVARFLGRYDQLCEVGIGSRTEVAARLADAGASVTAVDIEPPSPQPDSVRFVRDDVVDASRREDPGPAYRAEAIYGLNLPPELHPPVRRVAEHVNATFLFTTLGTDPPAVPATPITVGRETVFRARPRGSRSETDPTVGPPSATHQVGGSFR